MTEAQVRQKYVGVLQSWVGLKESDGSHKKIIDIYNKISPLPRSYAVKYTDSWCAATISAAAVEAGMTDIIPLECSCSKMIEIAKKCGIWQENDAYTPHIGDIIMYDWDDSGSGDDTGSPEHVGAVEKVAGSTITVIEGNKNNAVGRRNIRVNGRYIRGYICPKFSTKADSNADSSSQETGTAGTLKVGDVVNFTGTKHYVNSYTGAKSASCKSGKAKITAINKGASHPYHLVAVSGGGSNVYGWVNASDIKEAANTEIKVGDTVEYSGTVHYTSCYAGAESCSCKGGTAKVTSVKKGTPHPYHLVHTGKGCTVYGWVNADKVTK